MLSLHDNLSNHRWHTVGILFIVLWLTLPSYGNADSSIHQPLSLASQTQILEDESKALTIQDFIHSQVPAKFIANQRPDDVYLGYTPESSRWLKITIRPHQLTTHTYLSLGAALPISPQLFITDAQGQLISPEDYPVIASQHPQVWSVQLSPEKAHTLYLNFPASPYLLRFSPTLHTPQSFHTTTHNESIFFSVILAGLLIIGTYNVLLALILRESIYFRLGLLTVLLSALLHTEKLTHQLNTFLNIPNAEIPITMIALTSAFYAERIIHNKFCHRFEQALKILQWLSIITLIASLFLNIPITWVYITLLMIGSFILLFFIKIALAGHKPTRSLLAAGLFLIAFAYIYIGYKLGYTLLPTQSLYVIHATAVLFALALSLHQAAHSRTLTRKVEHARATIKTKDQILTTISHELRTPMNAIIGFNELAQQADGSTKQHFYLKKQAVASQHMLRLIDQILDFSSLDKHALHLDSKAFTLKSVLQELHLILIDQANSKGLKLHIHRPTHADEPVDGDAIRLLQILLNLAGNAIKFTEQGFVNVIIELHDINTRRLTYRFSIQDSGHGITPEDQERIFQPFAQADQSTTRRHQGTGLGLSISQELIRLMGGELSLTSTPGEGSCFSFLLSFPRANQ